MALTGYLAMTGAEILGCRGLPDHLGWFACRFSSQHGGLSNLPVRLPPGSLLILNDEIPCQGHDPGKITQQLLKLWETVGFAGLLLDFQRPHQPETAAIAQEICRAMPCPVGISEGYAHASEGPVFLSLQPLHQPLERALQPWQGREIWLEAGCQQEDIAVTAQGAAISVTYPPEELSMDFTADGLFCQYRIRREEKGFRFLLQDNRRLLRQRLQAAQSMGVTAAIGLYQELGGDFFTGLSG